MSSLATQRGTRARLKKAVHHHRLTSRRGLLERMFTLWFRGFVYNQIWEDPRVDAQALQLGPDSSLLSTWLIRAKPPKTDHRIWSIRWHSIHRHKAPTLRIDLSQHRRSQ